MAKTKKRILSLAMALVMVFTLLPVNALAGDNTISVTIYMEENGDIVGKPRDLEVEQVYTTNQDILFELDEGSEVDDEGIWRLVAFK